MRSLQAIDADLKAWSVRLRSARLADDTKRHEEATIRLDMLLEERSRHELMLVGKA